VIGAKRIVRTFSGRSGEEEEERLGMTFRSIVQGL
jgi:hypothetical protein